MILAASIPRARKQVDDQVAYSAGLFEVSMSKYSMQCLRMCYANDRTDDCFLDDDKTNHPTMESFEQQHK